MGGRQSSNWLMEVLEEMDLEDLEKSINLIGQTLLQIRHQMTMDLQDDTSSIFTTLQVALANGLEKLGRDHPDKLERAKYAEKYPNYMAAVEHSRSLADAFAQKFIANFFPVELEAWESHILSCIESHFAKNFECEAPEQFFKITRHVTKTVALDVFRHLKKRLGGMDVFKTYGLGGDNAMILAIKNVGKYEEEPNDKGETTGKAEEWDRLCRNLVKILAAAGATENPKIDSDATCSFGWSALVWAACINRLDMMEILLKSTADVNFADRYGRTALYFAAEKGNLEAVKLLLDCGADPSIRNAFGETAMHRAVKHKREEVVELLASMTDLDSATMATKCFTLCGEEQPAWGDEKQHRGLGDVDAENSPAKTKLQPEEEERREGQEQLATGP